MADWRKAPFASAPISLVKDSRSSRPATIASVVTQLSKRDSQIDLAFWVLGGAVAAYLF